MNKPSPPTEARLLDAQAMQTLKEVATEFAVFKSAASGKADSKSDPASMLTSVVAEAVDRPHADVAQAAKAQQRADAFAAHIVWLSEAPLLPGRAYLLKAAGQTIGSASYTNTIQYTSPATAEPADSFVVTSPNAVNSNTVQPTNSCA